MCSVCFLQFIWAWNSVWLSFKFVCYFMAHEHLDSGKYRPLLRVTGTSGELQLEADLPEMFTLEALGEIVLTTNRVTIRPRRNAYTGTLKPISFPF